MNYTNYFIIILILGFFGLGFMHEQVHVEIYRSYGIESHIEYFSHFPNWVTIAEQKCPTEMCEMAHNINEIVGYPLLILYCVFGIAILTIISQLELNQGGKR